MFRKKSSSEDFSPKELNKKYSSPFKKVSVWGTSIGIIVVGYIAFLWFFCPPGTVIRIGNEDIKDEEYLSIAENVSESFGMNNTQDTENYYSAFYRNYISDAVLLGMKAEKDGYVLTEVEKANLPKGDFQKYIALSKKIKDHTYNSISAPTNQEIENFYKENKKMFFTGDYNLTFQVFEGTEEQLNSLGEKAYRTKTMTATDFYERYGISDISFEKDLYSDKNTFPAYIKNVSGVPIYRELDNSLRNEISEIIVLSEYHEKISGYINEEKNSNPVKYF